MFYTSDQKNTEPAEESEHKSGASELPEYLKQKLRARGILTDDRAKEDTAKFENVSWFLSLRTFWACLVQVSRKELVL